MTTDPDLGPADLVVSAGTWPSNAELIADVARIGHLDINARTLDPTYEGGIWWKLWRPRELVIHDDYDPKTGTGTDFRALPYRDGQFTQIAYDPPYAATGGTTTSTVGEFTDRYGRTHAPKDAAGVQELINDGLTECARCLARPINRKARRPVLLTKCMDYVWSGDLWEGTYLTRKHAESIGLEVIDKFVHVGKPGPQPKRARCLGCARAIQFRRTLRWSDMRRALGVNTYECDGAEDGHHRPDPATVNRQDHAANNSSVLYVFAHPAPRRSDNAPALFD